MLDPDTFLTTLYVAVDDCCSHTLCKTRDGAVLARPPGPAASLSPSEVVTLVIFAQWQQFASERAFYRYATRQLRAAFPRLPTRAQFNRLARAQEPLVRRVFAQLVAWLVPVPAPYEVLDTTAAVTRNVRRHGHGHAWLAGQADIGWSSRLGYYEGFALLTSVTPCGVLTGFGLGPASTKEPLLADTFLAARHGGAGAAALATGPTRPAYYVSDGGFESTARQQRWWTAWLTHVLAPPRRSARARWPPPLRRWLATLRQMVETVNDKLHHTFRLAHERAHTLRGVQTRVAAMATLHNFCIWVNRQLGRPDLAFADLLDW